MHLFNQDFLFSRISVKAVVILQMFCNFPPAESKYFLTTTCGPGPSGGTGATGWIAEVQPRFASKRIQSLALCHRITEYSALEATLKDHQAFTHLCLNNLYIGHLYLRIRIRTLKT